MWNNADEIWLRSATFLQSNTKPITLIAAHTSFLYLKDCCKFSSWNLIISECLLHTLNSVTQDLNQRQHKQALLICSLTTKRQPDKVKWSREIIFALRSTLPRKPQNPDECHRWKREKFLIKNTSSWKVFRFHRHAGKSIFISIMRSHTQSVWNVNFSPSFWNCFSWWNNFYHFADEDSFQHRVNY